jgi:hypothetical protein
MRTWACAPLASSVSATSSVSRPWWRHQRASATPSVGALMLARASMP